MSDVPLPQVVGEQRGSPPAEEADEAIHRVGRAVAGYGARHALVAFSGGVDSSVVLALASLALGRHAVTAVTALSPSFPAGELDGARHVAHALGVAHQTLQTHEMDREAYARNDAMRCFHCKTELYATLGRLVSERGRPGTVVMAGANADDVHDFRPGLQAARQQGVRNPLLDQGIGKSLVRAIAMRLRLPVADKPALACLSSRVAYGIRITPDLLARIDRAEQAIRSLGFDVVRLRHLGQEATIEVPATDVGRLSDHPNLPGLLRELRHLGWDDVSVDPDGYRAGNLNALLTEEDVLRRPGRR